MPAIARIGGGGNRAPTTVSWILYLDKGERGNKEKREDHGRGFRGEDDDDQLLEREKISSLTIGKRRYRSGNTSSPDFTSRFGSDSNR